MLQSLNVKQSMEKIQAGLKLMADIEAKVEQSKMADTDIDVIVREVCQKMDTLFYMENPLFRRTIQSFL